jgi:hypothetical protein
MDGKTVPLRECDVFMAAWLKERVTSQRLAEDRPLLSELAEECRSEACAAKLNPAMIERALGATIEEAIVVVVNGLRDQRW